MEDHGRELGYGARGGAIAGASGAAFSQQLRERAATLAPPGQDRRASATAGEMERLGVSCDHLREVIRELDGRMTPMLRPDSPNAEKDGGRPLHGVGLADALAEVNSRVQASISHLRSLIERIDL